ncbi:NYN domain-containing protein [Schizophyllum fasciatum]
MGAVGIFWDYENCQYTAGRTGFDIARSIEQQARGHGLVRTFKAYLDIQQCAVPASLRSELQSSGVTLVDCPHNGQKNVVDLMLLTDMLVFALSESAPVTVVLVSGDRDFAYTTSLAAQVTKCVDWNQQILKMDEETPTMSPSKRKTVHKLAKFVPQASTAQKALEPSPEDLDVRSEGPDEAALAAEIEETLEADSDTISSSSSLDERCDTDSTGVDEVSPPQKEELSPQLAQAQAPPISSWKTQAPIFQPRAGFARFQPLIVVLQAHLRANDPYARRSLVGSELITRDPNIYARAGLVGFKEYTAAAEAAGVVVLGGLHAAAWIALTVAYGGIADGKRSNEAPETSATRYSRSRPPVRSASPSGSESESSHCCTPCTPSFGSSSCARSLSPACSPVPARKTVADPWQHHRARYRATHPAPVIAPKFRTLVDILDNFRKAGQDRPLRSTVGLALGREVYNRAGVSSFAAYVILAEAARLVRMGGKDGAAWITLDWAVQV